jgi:hypothetical protein
MRGFTGVLGSVFLALLQGLASLAGEAVPATQVPGTVPSASAVEGTWSVTPLVMKGVAAPGGSGQLLEFGEAYPTESFLAFWARTGPDPKKDWVLFSSKDGQLTRVLQRGVEFVAPDSRKVTVRWDTPIHVGKRLLYFSPAYPDHIYAWDGETLVKVLSAGDELQFRDEQFTIKRARVLDASPDGKALVYWDAPSQHASGWALHDGSSFIPLMRRGGELPGMPGASIENPRCLGECAATANETARLLGDGSILASLHVKAGARDQFALFRVFPQRTDVIVEHGSAFIGCDAQRLIFPSEAPPIRLTVRCGQRTFELSRREKGNRWEEEETSSAEKKRSHDFSAIMYGEGKTSVAFSYVNLGKVLAATPQGFAMQDGLQGEILVLYAGKVWMAEQPPIAGSLYPLDSAVFLAPDSPRALATMVTVEREGQWKLKGRVKIRSHPHLYFWNGEQLASVAWEDTVGINSAAVPALLQKPEGGLFQSDEDAAGDFGHIKMRAIPGPIGGVRVQLPALGDKPRSWYVPADSTDGTLQQPPRFAVAEHAITLADVISWKEDEVLALTEEGLFRLRRASQ